MRSSPPQRRPGTGAPSPMPEDVADNYRWQTQFRSHIEEIALGTIRISVATWSDDLRMNTDFQIATLNNGHRISCRARRSRYRHQYANDFTIRYALPSGTPTEWHKLRSGLGDYIIYGFDAGHGRLDPWHLINAHLVSEYLDDEGHWTLKDNDDGTRFAAINIDRLPIGAVINSSTRPRGIYNGPPIAPCDLCGQLVYNVGPINSTWVHPCCQRFAPHPCPYCQTPKSRYGWDAHLFPGQKVEA